LCFDECLVHCRETADLQPMNAEFIELILRDTAAAMFRPAPSDFARLSAENLLVRCARPRTAVREAKIDIRAQREFWMQLLGPPPADPKPVENPDLVKKLKRTICDRGYGGNDGELDLLKCALTLAPPSEEKAAAILFTLVGDNSSDDPLRRFGESASEIDKLAPEVFRAVVFFERLRRALVCARSCTWPPVDAGADAAEEYALLHALHRHGFKRLPAVLPSAPPRAALERRIRPIVAALLRHSSAAPERPILAPEEWRRMRGSKRLSQDAALRAFEVLGTFGVCETADHEVDVPETRQMARVPGPDGLIADVLAMAVELQADGSPISFEPFPAARRPRLRPRAQGGGLRLPPHGHGPLVLRGGQRARELSIRPRAAARRS
jgi:hypothetical protein